MLFDIKICKLQILKSFRLLSEPFFIQTDNLHTVPKNVLEKYVGILYPHTMLEVSQKVVLDLELEICIYET